MGQYVSRGGKQYYKGDDGKLYANFQDANLSNSPADQAIRGIGQGFGYVGGVLQDVLNAQGGPSWQGRSASALERGLVGNPSVAGWAQAPGRPEGTQAILNRKPVQWSLDGGKGSWVRDYQNEGDIMREILAEQAAKRAATQTSSSAPSAPILPPPGGRSPITSPNTTYQAADEEYRNLLAQYGGAPGISQLAGMTSLPTGFTPTGASKQATLKDYYAAQALQGNANLGTITSSLTQGLQGTEAKNMAAWAKANPGLAQQAYAKQMGAGQSAAPGGRDIGSFIGDVNRYANQEPSSSDEAAFGTIANPVAPTTAWNQGAMVDANRGKDNLLPQQAAKTTPDGGMPALNTTAGQPSTGNKVANFLNEINPVLRTLVGPGGIGPNPFGIGRW